MCTCVCVLCVVSLKSQQSYTKLDNLKRKSSIRTTATDLHASWGRHHSLFKLTIIMHGNHTDNHVIEMANDLMCIKEITYDSGLQQ